MGTQSPVPWRHDDKKQMLNPLEHDAPFFPHNLSSGTKYISLFLQRPFHFRVYLIVIHE